LNALVGLLVSQRGKDKMNSTCRIWEVIGAIRGNCVYVKQELTRDEAHDFVRKAHMADGTMQWTFPDGEMFSAQAGTCAAWARIMWDHRKANSAICVKKQDTEVTR